MQPPVPCGKGATASVGILMLDTRFPRPVGDVGNPATWPFPVLYATVPGADVERAVRLGGDGLLEPFARAGRMLVADGAAMLTTSCGFLAPFGPALAERCGVPVAASSLLQVPWIAQTLPPDRRVGILTIAASALAPSILKAAGIANGTPIATLEGGTFAEAILNDRTELDVVAAEREHVAAARDLLQRHPSVGAFVLECTNMPPYASAIRAEIGLPVFSIVSLVQWMHATLAHTPG